MSKAPRGFKAAVVAMILTPVSLAGDSAAVDTKSERRPASPRGDERLGSRFDRRLIECRTRDKIGRTTNWVSDSTATGATPFMLTVSISDNLIRSPSR